jgi:lambda family phage portal protein
MSRHNRHDRFGRQTFTRTPLPGGGMKATFFQRTGPTVIGQQAQLPYDAASLYGRGADMATSNPGVNNALVGYGWSLRARSRDLYRQNGLIAGAVDEYISQLVGPGFSMLPSTGDKGFDRELTEIIEEWESECDADGVTNFDGLTNLWERSAFVGGDSFIQFVHRDLEASLTVPLQLRVIESEFCPLDLTEVLPNGERTVMGVILDQSNRRTGYQLYREHPEDWVGITGMFSDERIRVPAEQLLHRYFQSRPGQLRGEPQTTRAIIAAYGLDSYFDGELKRKDAVAKLSMVITRAASESSTAFDDIFADQQGDGPEEFEVINDAAGDIVFEPGSVLSMEPGETVEVVQSADVGGSFEPFMKVAHRHLARSLNVLYEHVSGDYSSGNDRLFRAAENNFKRALLTVHQTQVVPQTVRPIYRQLVNTAVMAGVIKPPRGMAERQMLRAMFVPTEWDYIHPVQEEQARRLRLENGVSSVEREVASMGEAVEDVDQERAQDIEKERTEKAKESGQEASLGRQVMFDNGSRHFDPVASRREWHDRGFQF